MATVTIIHPVTGDTMQTHGPFADRGEAEAYVSKHQKFCGFPSSRYVIVEPGALRTFLIHLDVGDDNFDLLVRAANRDDAIAYWRRTFDVGDAEPDTIYEIGDLSRHGAGAVLWMGPELQLVGGTRFAGIMGARE